MKKILITGGAGFIGSNLALKLSGKGYSVTVLDNLSTQIHGSNPEITSPLFLKIMKKVKFIKGERSLKGQDAVIHFAAETGTGQSMYQIEKYSNVNIGGTAILLDILANSDNSINKILIASSRAIYGEGKYKCKEHGIVYPAGRNVSDLSNGEFDCKCPKCQKEVMVLPTSEDSQIHPASMYAITKYTQEQMVMTMAKALGIPAVAFRYQNVYGPGQSLSNPYTGILSIFSTQIKNGNDIAIFEDGLESRDFVYIDDVVNATILGLESNSVNYEVFNVGSGTPVNIITVAKELILNYDREVKYEITGNYRLGDIRHNYADLTKISKLLGYKPKYTFKHGINLFIKWVNNQSLSIDLYTTSISELKARGLLK